MKVVFWDWNGTLVNDAPTMCRIFNRVVESRGLAPVSLEQYRELYQHPIQSMYEAAGLDLSRHSFHEIAEEWHEHYLASGPSIQLHHDSITTLEWFKQRGSRQVVLSALPHDIVNTSVPAYSIEHFFEHVVGISDKYAHSKVAEGRALRDRLGMSGSDITIIGDSSHDAEVARAISAQCILIARGSESRRRLEQAGFPVFDSLQAFVDQRHEVMSEA
jgi:phosphoglycolate phosphatase